MTRGAALFVLVVSATWGSANSVTAQTTYRVVRASRVYDGPSTLTARIGRLEPPATVSETEGAEPRSDYIPVDTEFGPGWIYGRHLAVIATSDEDVATAPTALTAMPLLEGDGPLVCSFNVKFVGYYGDKRKDDHLAEIVEGCDVVLVQEVVAPPTEHRFDDRTVSADEDTRDFFDAFTDLDFEYVLSEEDTGRGERNHLNSSQTEWFVAFYRDDRVEYAEELPHGFLADDRSAHPSYDRVPYAFAFRARDSREAFVLISVHLRQGHGRADTERRRTELNAIAEWVEEHDDEDDDFFIVGDMNFKNCDEITAILPEGFVSLNHRCLTTNTSPTKPRPYDNVLYRPATSGELIYRDAGLHVVDLIVAAEDRWEGGGFPGRPYTSDFQKFYSDHHPTQFRLATAAGPE